MKKILWVKTSLSGAESQSNQLAEYLIDQFKAQGDTVELIERDLATDPVPHLDSERFAAMTTAESDRTAAQNQIMQQVDQLIEEVIAADLILVGMPMYNFNISSQLKAWFDHLARAGVSFKYTDKGPVGLLEDKPVYLLGTRGGMYAESGQDFQTAYVKQFFAFIGLKDTRVVLAEGLAMPDQREQSLERARQALVS